MASTEVRLLSVPSAVVMSAAVKLVGASLKAKLMVAEPSLTLTSELLLIETATVGVTVSTVKLVEPPDPALPLFSCQLAPVTLTEPMTPSSAGCCR